MPEVRSKTSWRQRAIPKDSKAHPKDFFVNIFCSPLTPNIHLQVRKDKNVLLSQDRSMQGLGVANSDCDVACWLCTLAVLPTPDQFRNYDRTMQD